MERLKADGKDAIFWDADLAGFGVSLHATGRKLYIVESRGPSGLKRVTPGRVGTETVEERLREAVMAARRPRLPLGNQHQPSVQQLPSGHLRSAQFPSA